jgi:hypothetical protein
MSKKSPGTKRKKYDICIINACLNIAGSISASMFRESTDRVSAKGLNKGSTGNNSYNDRRYRTNITAVEVTS